MDRTFIIIPTPQSLFDFDLRINGNIFFRLNAFLEIALVPPRSCVCDFNLNVCCQSVWLAVSKSIIFDFQMRKYKRVTRVKARENRKVGNRIRFGQLRCKHACTKLNAGDEKKKINKNKMIMNEWEGVRSISEISIYFWHMNIWNYIREWLRRLRTTQRNWGI